MISGFCIFIRAFLQMSVTLDSSSLYTFFQSPQLCRADSEQSLGDISQLLQHLWTHPIDCHSWFSTVSQFDVLNLIQNSPGKIVGRFSCFLDMKTLNFLSFHICLVLWNLKSTGHASDFGGRGAEFGSEVSEKFISGNCRLNWNFKLLNMPVAKCRLRHLWITNIVLGETKGRDLHCIAV